MLLVCYIISPCPAVLLLKCCRGDGAGFTFPSSTPINYKRDRALGNSVIPPGWIHMLQLH